MSTKEEFEKPMEDLSQVSSNGVNDAELDGGNSDATGADSGGIRSGSDTRAHSDTISTQSDVEMLRNSSPSKPAAGPGPSLEGRERQGIVIAKVLDIRKDHSTSAESMGWLSPGDQVTILNTWTDGENTWAQLGPDRWAAIVYNGESLIDLID
jgi:hypothetical protein